MSQTSAVSMQSGRVPKDRRDAMNAEKRAKGRTLNAITVQ
jgi:hypothetical protein